MQQKDDDAIETAEEFEARNKSWMELAKLNLEADNYDYMERMLASEKSLQVRATFLLKWLIFPIMAFLAFNCCLGYIFCCRVGRKPESAAKKNQ